MKNGKGERIGDELDGSRLQFTARCNKTRQNYFFFPNEKERKLCKKRRRGERGGRRGEVFDLIQRYYKLSECACLFSVTVLQLLIYVFAII